MKQLLILVLFCHCCGNFIYSLQGFPGGSDGKEFACNAGDLGSIPGSERSLEKRMATHSSIVAWRIPWSLVGYSPWADKESDMTEKLSLLLYSVALVGELDLT